LFAIDVPIPSAEVRAHDETDKGGPEPPAARIDVLDYRRSIDVPSKLTD
jgi:hypothetical protein